VNDALEKHLTSQVAGLIHADKPLEAAKLLCDTLKIKLKLENEPAKYNPVLVEYLHHLMNSGKPYSAARLLWTDAQFNSGPQSTRDVWDLFDRSSQGLIMGGGSLSKSYSMGVRFLLEWIRDPQFTTIKVIGPSQDHLESNLFSHITGLHQTAKLPLPGVIGELFIGLSRRDQLSSLKGVIIPIGKVKKAGRIQGAKRRSRPNVHPIFGPLSRMFIFVDEIENVPGGLWSDIDNILSNIQEEGDTQGFKIFGAYNPSNRDDEVGKRAEPPFGWDQFDIDGHYKWRSTRGWDVVRLDGEKSENVITGKIVYPGLQTRAGLEAIARNSGGKQSAGYYTMGRGAYPPSGVELTIIPPGLVSKARGTFIWYDAPIPVASCDLALEGGANAVYTVGKWGKVTGIVYPPTLEFPDGRKFMFKDRSGRQLIRWGLQADKQFILPKGDTRKMTNQIIDVNRKASVRGQFFCCDRTTVGSGVADLLRDEWSNAIHDINMSGSASESKIMAEDKYTCKEEYYRVESELWFAMKIWMEFCYLLIAPEFDMSKITSQLTQRKFRSMNGKTKVEPKRDYISRGLDSPDEADSLAQLVHAARKGSGLIPSMKMEESLDLPGADFFDGWEDEMYLRNGVMIDESNRTQFLDDGARPMKEDALL